MCRQQAPEIAQDSTTIQCCSTTMQEAEAEYMIVGNIRDGEEELVEAEILQFVRQVLQTAKADITNNSPNGARAITYDQLGRLLQRRLTVHQFNFVFTELIRDVDLHEVLKKVDHRQFATKIEKQTIARTINYLNHDPDGVAIKGKAVTTTCVQLLTNICQLYGGANMLHAFGAVGTIDCVVAGFVFTAFSMNEIRRYRSGEITSKVEMFKNIGEHAVGCISSTTAGLGVGYVGGMGGAYVGMQVGAFLGPAGAAAGAFGGCLLGAIAGSIAGSMTMDALGRLAYRKLFPRSGTRTVEEEVDREVALSLREKADAAAATLGIKDVSVLSFSEARIRYRKLLVAHHPDRFQASPENIQEEQKNKTIEILSAWSVVNTYYQTLPRSADDDDVDPWEAGDAFVKLSVLRERISTTAGDSWRVVRSWFGDLGLGRPLTVNEQIDTVVIYT